MRKSLFLLCLLSLILVSLCLPVNETGLPTSALLFTPADPYVNSSPHEGTVVVRSQHPPILPLSSLSHFLENAAQALNHIEELHDANLYARIPNGYFLYSEQRPGFTFEILEVAAGRRLLFWQVYRVLEVLEMWERGWRRNRRWKGAMLEYHTFGGSLIARGRIAGV